MRNNNQRNQEINKRRNLRDKNNKKKGMQLTVVSDLSLVLKVTRSSEGFLGSVKDSLVPCVTRNLVLLDYSHS